MYSEKYTALVFGASGLTGKFVTEHLIADSAYDTIKIFVRKEINIQHGKVKQIIFKSEDVEQLSTQLSGDHLFCCIGTTIKKAGSKEVFYRTDHDLVERIAQIASSNKVKSFIVISSIGARDNSSNFYLNTKGKMEESIKTFSFNNLCIVRPSMLLGLRNERRLLEDGGKILIRVLSPLLIGFAKKYRPIHASTVAKAMIKLAKDFKGTNTIESDQLEILAIQK
jgi:uncharacterized protein YbjT (DUF2867 family)